MATAVKDGAEERWPTEFPYTVNCIHQFGQPTHPATRRVLLMLLHCHEELDCTWRSWMPTYRLIEDAAKLAGVRLTTYINLKEWLQRRTPTFTIKGETRRVLYELPYDPQDWEVMPFWTPDHHLSRYRFTLFLARDVMEWFWPKRQVWRCCQCGRRPVGARIRYAGLGRWVHHGDWDAQWHYGDKADTTLWVCSMRCEQQRERTWRRIQQARLQLKSVRRWLAQPKTKRDASVSPIGASRQRQTSRSS